MGRSVEAPEGAAQVARLGSYEIVRKLARGGMAELFLARTVGPEGFAKLVVLKKILPSYAANQKFVRLFLDEAKLVAQMEHPHIAHVYDMGKEGNDYFFTMEYVHGQDLRSVWRRAARRQRPFPVEHAVQITRNIAAALHYAHERTRDDGTLLDIVHRDVSPSNILLSYDGATKLVDFGVAKAATSTVKTRTGALKGKISYMSPEQAKGAGIDRRSDVFSLGIVLWELLAGRRLYKADNDLATIQMIINSKPQPPSQLRADCTAKLDAIVARALDASTATRYQTAEEMQLDLESLAHELRYNQSESALRVFMNELFDEEIRAWMDAHAQGRTLIDHVLAAQPTLILPISESDDLSEGLEDDDLIEDDDGEPDDDSLADSSITNSPPTVSGLPPTAPRQAVFDEMRTLTNEDQATHQLQAQPATIQLAVPPPVRAHTEPSMHMGPAPAAFPVAPASWRLATQPAPVVDTTRETLTRHVLIGCSIVLGLVVLLAIALAGGSDEPTRTPVEESPTESMPPGPKVEMRVVPARP